MNFLLSFARMRQFAPLMLMLASAAVAVAAYLQAIDYTFVADDINYISNNTKLAELHLFELWRLFIEPYNDLSEFLPLRDLSYWIDIVLFGQSAAAFRGHNILLYLLCLPLIYGATLGLWRYFRPADAASAPWAAATVTALFALHPALVESVVWISGRKYVLPNLFSMLALWFAVNARREHGFSSPHAAAALVAFVAVMLSKASYVAVAPVIAMLWVVFWRDIQVSKRRRSLLLWPFSILLLAGFMVRVFIASSKETEQFYFGIESITRILAVLGWLTRLAISPESRHFLYPVFEDPYLPFMVSIGVVVLATAAASGVMLLRKRSLEGFALAAFLLLCMPYMQMLPYGAPSLVTDRFLTLAIWPAILLLVALSWRLKPLPRATLLLAIALPWVFQTAERPRDWSSNEAILDADLRAYPGYYMPALYKIIIVQLPRKQHGEAMATANGIAAPELRDIMAGLIKADNATTFADSTGNPQEAMALLWKLGFDHKLRPAQAKWNSPINLFWAKKQDMLEYEWKFLVKRFPDDVSVRYNAGLWMLENHKSKDSVAHLRVATESQLLPEAVRGTAFKNLGLALLRSGQVVEAEAPLRAALEQSPPDLRAHCLLSKVYQQTKRFEEAARAEAGCPGRASNVESAQ